MAPALSPEAWAHIRHDYEHSDRPVAATCAEYRISTGTLRDRMHRWNWARRRPAVAQVDVPLAPTLETLTPTPTLPLAAGGSAGAEPSTEADPASIAASLQGAVGRVLPAIEATLARLAAGPQHPREMEQAARALNTMMRTLRELNALLAQQQARAASRDDDIPEDIDELREKLAQRIEAFMEARGYEKDAFDDDEPAGAQS